MRIAAPFLSLLGHELRAPAGVVGGYLAILETESERLSPRQRQALAGARKAQQAIVDGLDDLRRLTLAWQGEDEPLTRVGLPQLAATVGHFATARGVPLRIVADQVVAVPRRGRDDAMAEGLAAVAEAVAREHGAEVVATTHVDGTALTWRVLPADTTLPADGVVREAFDLSRAGLGVRLVSAAISITSSAGRLEDLRVDGQRAGVEVTFDLAAPDADASA